MSTRKKIIFVAQNFGSYSNGPGTYANYLWQSFLDDRNIEFHVVAHRSTIEHERIHVCGTDATTGSSILKSGKAYKEVENKALKVASELGEGTVIHCNVCIYTRLLNSGNKVIGQINDYDTAEIYHKISYTYKKFGLRRVLSLIARRIKEKQMVRKQDLTICNSKFTEQLIRKYYKVRNSKKVITIHKAVDVQFFSRPDNFVKKEKSTFDLLYVGSNWRRKGLLEIIQAMKSVSDNVNLTIFGPEEYEVKSILQPLIDELGLTKRILFHKKVEREELREVYWNSDAFIMPSKAEAFGVVLLEAMSAGLPVISSNIGGIPEIVSSDQYGLLVDRIDSVSIAAKINVLFNDQELQVNLANNGIHRSNEFTKEVMIGKIREVYLNAQN